MPESDDVEKRLREAQRRELARSWTHAHEEDREGQMVFRRSEVSLPPSRGRMTFSLEPSGNADVGGPGPDDRRAHNQGSWDLRGDVLTLRVPGQGEQRFQIVSADGERLVVRRL